MRGIAKFESCERVCEGVKYLVSELYYFRCYSTPSGNDEHFAVLPRTGSVDCTLSHLQSVTSVL